MWIFRSQVSRKVLLFHYILLKQKLPIILDVFHAPVIRTVESDICVTLDILYRDPKSDWLLGRDFIIFLSHVLKFMSSGNCLKEVYEWLHVHKSSEISEERLQLIVLSENDRWQNCKPSVKSQLLVVSHHKHWNIISCLLGDLDEIYELILMMLTAVMLFRIKPVDTPCSQSNFVRRPQAWEPVPSLLTPHMKNWYRWCFPSSSLNVGRFVV
jgi:hypothetical protein